MKEKLAFVIPAYNEEETIVATLKDVRRQFPGRDVFVVNDGSVDKTRELAIANGGNVLSHIINRGLGAALSTGIQAAVQSGADIIITFDADLQHLGKDVYRLIKPIQDGKADATIGSRFLSKHDKELMPSIKRIGNTMLTGVTNLLADTTITDSQSGLRAFNKEAAQKLMILCDKYEVSSEIIHQLGHHNMRIIEIPIKAIYDDRSVKRGTGQMPWKNGLHIVWSMILRTLGIKK
ncbi:MAG: glycosyltransferase family 2 protein [Candidatus Undinarchaeales archaeon]|jgi:glycosyltransferase involved in cell wall biosynthesis|nr:glycosyltransferase family 2 protein [Candidatus Undinarchaeales archaeon]